MLYLYNEIIYRPILNVLVSLYNNIPGQDIGIAIIIITLALRFIMAPLMTKSLKGQRAMASLQPKLNEIREKFKDNKEGQAKAMMDLYKENNINPLASCLPLLIQLPVLIALYQVFSKALNANLNGLYNFVSNPGNLDPRFLNLIDLSQPNIAFAIIAGLAQFWQSKMMLSWQGNNVSTEPTAKMISMQMTYILPIVSVFIAWNLPAGLPLYWIVTTLFAVAQQYYIMKKYPLNEPATK